MADRPPRLIDLAPFNPIVDLRRVNDAVVTRAYRAGALAARFTPGLVANGLVTPLGFGAQFASAERRSVIERNLRRADPTLRGLRLRRAVQESFDFYTKYYIESFRLPTMSRRTVNASFREEGYHQIVEARRQGTGVILALPHLGGWEWAGRWLVDQGHPVTVVVEKLDPPELYEWFVDLREKLGMRVIALGPDVAAGISKALKDNHVVCLLCDRDIQRNGPEVEFFGETTSLPSGPALFGLRSDAPVLPTAVYFTDRFDGHLGAVGHPLPTERRGRLREDVNRITQDLARRLEALIRRAPTQWHMFQPNWPSDPGY